jgi:hypothetical protein
MKRIFESIRPQDEALSPWIDKLVALFKAMDDGYAKAADRHGFVCRGCEDNCCQSRFYHHTLLEYMSIYRGYSRLAVQERQQADTRAEPHIAGNMPRQMQPAPRSRHGAP